MKSRWALLWILLYVIAHSANGRVALAQARSASPEKNSGQKSVKNSAENGDDSADDEDSDDDSDDDDDEETAPQAKSAAQVGKSSASQSDEEDDDQEDDEEDDDKGDIFDSSKSVLGETSGNVTLATDYILRGITQTDHQPSVQGGYEWYHPTGVFLGVSGANVHFPSSSASFELDGYGGYSYDIAKKLNVSAAISYYSYFASEGKSGFDFPVDLAWRSFRFEVDYAPDWQGEGSVWYLQGGWTDQVIWDFKLGLFVGYSMFGPDADTPDYADFRASIAHNFMGLEWSLTGVDTSQREINDTDTGPRAIFAISKSF